MVKGVLGVNQKIAFIACVNSELYKDEMQYYINRLTVPEGYEVDTICVEGATSMAAGYNYAMQQTDAKYKIYLHQDVFITNKSFLIDMLQIFSDSTIGMMGLVGCVKEPEDANFATCWEYGCVAVANSYSTYKIDTYPQYISSDAKSYNVKAIDGMLMATQYDIPWDDEHFDSFHFYDISQSNRFRDEGYNIVIPVTQNTWAIHDCGVNLDYRYDRYRKTFCKLYPRFLYDKGIFDDIIEISELESKYDKLIEYVTQFEAITVNQVIEIISELQQLVIAGYKNRRVLLTLIYYEILIKELEDKSINTILQLNIDDFSEVYRQCVFIFWRKINKDKASGELLDNFRRQGLISNQFIDSVNKHNKFDI